MRPSDLVREALNRYLGVGTGTFEVYMDRTGKFRFRLTAATGEVVTSGEAYETAAAAKEACMAFTRAAGVANIVETEA